MLTPQLMSGSSGSSSLFSGLLLLEAARSKRLRLREMRRGGVQYLYDQTGALRGEGRSGEHIELLLLLPLR